MNRKAPKPFILFTMAVAVVTTAATAGAGSCSNTCVTMAIPHSPGVLTRLDGEADAVLWPASHALQTIRISALNDQAESCDVTIDDVRQDAALGTSLSGASVDSAVNCRNDGNESTIELASDRSEGGRGRAYHIRFTLSDPDCERSSRSDEVLVVVPHEDQAFARLPVETTPASYASYSGGSLECTPEEDVRLAAGRSGT